MGEGGRGGEGGLVGEGEGEDVVFGDLGWVSLGGLWKGETDVVEFIPVSRPRFVNHPGSVPFIPIAPPP